MSSTKQEAQSLVQIGTAALLLGLSTATVRKLVAQGRLQVAGYAARKRLFDVQHVAALRRLRETRPHRGGPPTIMQRLAALTEPACSACGHKAGAK